MVAKTVLIVLVIMVVLGGIAYLCYYFMTKPHLDAVTVEDTVPVTGLATYHTLDTLRISTKSSHVPNLDYSYSTDNGKTFNKSIAQDIPSATSVSWVIDPTIYSRQCVIRAADTKHPTKHYVDSPSFAVTPSFTLNIGLKPTEIYVVPNTVTVSYNCSSPLLTVDNMELQICTTVDGTFTTIDGSLVTIVPTQTQVQWQVAAELAGTKQYLRLTTTNLVSQGYPAELTATTQNQLSFTSDGSNGKNTVGDTFTQFVVYGDAQHTQLISGGNDVTTHLLCNETLYFVFSLQEGATPLTLNDVTFSYQILSDSHLSSDTWIPMDKMVIVNEQGTNEYSWNVPYVAETDDATISFRVQQTNTNVRPFPEARVTGINVSQFIYIDGSTPQNKYGDLTYHKDATTLQVNEIRFNLVTPGFSTNYWSMMVTPKNASATKVPVKATCPQQWFSQATYSNPGYLNVDIRALSWPESASDTDAGTIALYPFSDVDHIVLTYQPPGSGATPPSTPAIPFSPT